MKNKVDMRRFIPISVIIFIAFLFFYMVTPRIMMEDVYQESFHIVMEEEPMISKGAKGYELSFRLSIEPIDPLEYKKVTFRIQLNPEVRKADSSIPSKYNSVPYRITKDEDLLSRKDPSIVSKIDYTLSYPIKNPYEVEKSLKEIRVLVYWDHFYQEKILQVRVVD